MTPDEYRIALNNVFGFEFNHISLSYLNECPFTRHIIVLTVQDSVEEQKYIRHWLKKHCRGQHRAGFFQAFAVVFLEDEDDALLAKLSLPVGEL